MAFPIGVENRMYVTAFNLKSKKNEEIPIAEMIESETPRMTMIFRGKEENEKIGRWYVMEGHLTSNNVVFDTTTVLRKAGKMIKGSDGIVRFIANLAEQKAEPPSHMTAGEFDGPVDCLVAGNGDVYFSGDPKEYRGKALELGVPCEL